MGPTCYVQMAKTTTEKPKPKSGMIDGGEGEKGKEAKEIVGACGPNITTSSALHAGGRLYGEAGIAGWGDRGRSDEGRGEGFVRATGAGGDRTDIYMDMPELVEDASVAKSDSGSTCSSNGVESVAQEEEGKRLVNEVRRILLLHPEHAMTLTELLEAFVRQEDPATPTVQSLYRHLETMDGATKKFEVITS